MRTRVLIVDSDVSFRRELSRYLTTLSAGYEVVGEVGTDRDALARIARLTPDVVLMDLDLPDRSGLATTQRIRRGWPGIAVIAMSDNPAGEYRQAALDAGAADYIDKLDVVKAAPRALATVIGLARTAMSTDGYGRPSEGLPHDEKAG